MDDNFEEIKRLSKKLATRGTMSVDGWVQKAREQNPIRPSEYKELTSITCRRKGSKRAMLTAEDKMKIVHKYVILKIPAASIAREFRISIPYISALVKKS